jgi:glycosyltransferase involved in cell wall biosynthesis
MKSKPDGQAHGLSVIIPASNEAALIGNALAALLSSQIEDGVSQPLAVEIVVVANGCSDDTAGVARSFTERAKARGWSLTCLDIAEGGKLNALNVGDENASHDNRVYLDADVIVGPGLLAALADVLDKPEPVYASGILRISRARSFVTRLYARFWSKLPFVSQGVPGCGLFAVNAAGRARWGRFPDIVSDDTFVRLQFSPPQRLAVPEYFDWPMVEGFRNLVRVRRRQDRGVREVARLYPELGRNNGKTRPGFRMLARLALRDPLGFIVYSSVSAVVRMSSENVGLIWERGR